MDRLIYLDNSATTRISEEALLRYNEVSREYFGNPSSLHGVGLDAERVMNEARTDILATLGASGDKLIFTGSGSEANNLAILGRAFAKERYRRGKRIITTAGEHASVRVTLKRLEEMGFDVVYIPTRGGAIDMAAVEAAMNESVILVTMMAVNNETGADYTSEIGRVSAIMKRKSPEGVLHVDATQGYFKTLLKKSTLGADMITISAHKIEGPKGVGALTVDKRLIGSKGLSPIIFGGGQELGLRSGTENVPAIAAFAVAAKQGFAEMRERIFACRSLRDRIISGIKEAPELSEVKINEPQRSAPHILNITLPRIKSETMLHFLSSVGIFVSSGSACSSNSAERDPGGALPSFGLSAEEADFSIRISLSHRNTESDADELITGLCEGVSRLARKR